MISIIQEMKTDTGWIFMVRVSEEKSTTEHTVTLSESYWKKLTERKISPKQLVQKSFGFLLERESKESILKEFNVRQIMNYFPEYELTMKDQKE